jgi:hypothetical protein
MSLDIDKTKKEIQLLKSSIIKGYEYIDETPLPEHIVKHMLKRLDAEENKLDKLEKALKKSISDREELQAQALFLVRNSW